MSAKSPTQLVRAVLFAASCFRDHDFTCDPTRVIESLDKAVDDYRAWLNSIHHNQRAKRIRRAVENAAQQGDTP